MNPAYLVPFLGILSLLTPCMWNVNLLFRAYVKRGHRKQIPLLFLSRLALFNLIAFIFFILSGDVHLSGSSLLTAQGLVAGVFLIGFPLMRRAGSGPFDLSLQFFFPERRFPPGIGLGLSFPYCTFPFVALLGVYSLYLREPFLIFNLYVLSATLPALLLPLLPEGLLRKLTSLVPAVPALTGLLLIIATALFKNFQEVVP